MSEKTISQQIGEISARLTLADIDERTIKNAKIFLLDCLGCILSGSQIVNAKAIRAAVKHFADDGECTVFGTKIMIRNILYLSENIFRFGALFLRFLLRLRTVSAILPSEKIQT